MATIIHTVRKAQASVDAANLPDVRALVQALFPAVPPADAVELRFWREGEDKVPMAMVAYSSDLTPQEAADAMAAQDIVSISGFTP